MKRYFLALVVLTFLAGCSTTDYEGRTMRNPEGNALASFLLPGTGQFCNKEYGAGIAHLSLTFLFAKMYIDSGERHYVSTGPFTTISWMEYDEKFLFITLGISAFSAITAYQASQQYNQKNAKQFNIGVVPVDRGASLFLTFVY